MKKEHRVAVASLHMLGFIVLMVGALPAINDAVEGWKIVSVGIMIMYMSFVMLALLKRRG